MTAKINESEEDIQKLHTSSQRYRRTHPISCIFPLRLEHRPVERKIEGW